MGRQYLAWKLGAETGGDQVGDRDGIVSPAVPINVPS